MFDSEISILGGGWSVRGLDLKKLPGYIIGVNDAGVHATCDAIVSMDRLWTENRWPFLAERSRDTYIRSSALKNVAERPGWLHPFENDNAGKEMSESVERLNGNNSGFCALNLAYIMRPSRIRLYGFDMNRGPDGIPYWYPPYPWAKPAGGTGNARYADWAKGFDIAAKACRAAAIEVVNMSATSAITTFRKEKA